MTNPFFDFFNRERPEIPRDKSLWPDSWKKIEYKTYPRNTRIKLPIAELGDMSLRDAIINRKSQRNFSIEPLNSLQISSMLYFGAGIVDEKADKNYVHRVHPSGGARFPIETYIAALNVEGLEGGIYHYNVLEHSVEFLTEADDESIKGLSRYEFVSKAAAIFIFTMISNRSTQKYGNSGLKVGLIEAGHMAENMYLISSALKLKCCVVGGIYDQVLTNKLLDIDGINEVAFYLLALGK